MSHQASRQDGSSGRNESGCTGLRNLGQKLDDSLLRGLSFLRSSCCADGLWRDFRTLAGQSSEWVTAFVSYALTTADSRDEAAKSAMTILSSHQRQNGGWAYNEAVPADCDSTAWTMLSLMASHKCDPGVIGAGTDFLCQHQPQSLSGGFSTYIPSDGIDVFIKAQGPESTAGWLGPHVCVTAVALQALIGSQQPEHDDRVALALRYLLQKRLSDGTWKSYWWKGRAYSTYHALKALSLAGAFRREYSLAVAQYFVAVQRAEGGWANGSNADSEPCSFETAFALLALSLCGSNSQSDGLARGVHWLFTQQKEDGSWPSVPILRIPAPQAKEPDNSRKWRRDEVGTRVIIRDEARLFTTAAVVWALAQCRAMPELSALVNDDRT